MHLCLLSWARVTGCVRVMGLWRGPNVSRCRRPAGLTTTVQGYVTSGYRVKPRSYLGPGIPPPKCISGMWGVSSGMCGVSRGMSGRSSGASGRSSGISGVSGGASGLSIGAAAGGGDGIAAGAGAGRPYGPPAHTGSAGMLMHRGSAGPLGAPPAAKGPPWHWAILLNAPAHLGSFGLVGRLGSGGSRGAGVLDTPANPGVAFAGTTAPVTATPMNVAAAAVLVRTPRTPKAVPQLINRSLRADPKRVTRTFAVIDASRAHHRTPRGKVVCRIGRLLSSTFQLHSQF